MSEYDNGYKLGQEAYSMELGEAYTYYRPGSEGYRGFADGFIESSYQCQPESWEKGKYRHERNLSF